MRLLIFESTVVDDPLSALEFVDDLQRLGISYHFNEEISSVLKMIYAYYFNAHDNWNKSNLTLKALGFRLLRQHGYHVPQGWYPLYCYLNSYLINVTTTPYCIDTRDYIN